MSIEAIEEYLTIAEHCISTPKANGGLYGYPSVLLLFCVIDALSNYVGHPKNTLRGIRTIFPGVNQKQIQNLKSWYRSLPAHQAIIMPGTQLSAEPSGDPIEFGPDGEPTCIRVIPFYQFVKHAWEAFDKGRIKPTFDMNQLPNKRVRPSTSLVPGISGCYVTTAKP
jgi:hypothetical protein